MLLKSATIPLRDFERATGWVFKPEGACKGDQCIPLPAHLRSDVVDAEALAQVMGLPLAKDESFGLMAVGPESIGSRALVTAKAPDIELPDLDGNLFRLSSLEGQKVLVYAWAPY
jgi:hypothetical protein